MCNTRQVERRQADLLIHATELAQCEQWLSSV